MDRYGANDTARLEPMMGKGPLRGVCLAVVLAVCVPGAFGAEIHGVELPDSRVVAGKTLRLNGLGARVKSFLNVRVYVAGLYLEAPSDDARRIIATDGTRRIELRMTHAAPRARLTREILDGIERNARDDMPTLRQRLDLFLAGIPDLKEGGLLSITYVPGVGTHMDATGAGDVTVPGKDFADAVFSAWLGEHPLDGELKARLLGAAPAR